MGAEYYIPGGYRISSFPSEDKVRCINRGIVRSLDSKMFSFRGKEGGLKRTNALGITFNPDRHNEKQYFFGFFLNPNVIWDIEGNRYNSFFENSKAANLAFSRFSTSSIGQIVEEIYTKSEEFEVSENLVLFRIRQKVSRGIFSSMPLFYPTPRLVKALGFEIRKTREELPLAA